MRIIGGKWKGRVVQVPRNLPVRPTMDRSKEALFNILQNSMDFENKDGLELFAGTGSISLEFLSRGIQSMVAYDLSYSCVSHLKSLIKKFELSNFKVRKGDVMQLLRGKHNLGSFDIIFADPPFNMPGIIDLPDLILESMLLKEGGLFILEHPSLVRFPDSPYLDDVRKYGESTFRFYIKS